MGRWHDLRDDRRNGSDNDRYIGLGANEFNLAVLALIGTIALGVLAFLFFSFGAIVVIGLLLGTAIFVVAVFIGRRDLPSDDSPAPRQVDRVETDTPSAVLPADEQASGAMESLPNLVPPVAASTGPAGWARVAIVVPVVISLAVVLAVVAALWILGSDGGQRDKFSTLAIVPEDVVFYMAINTEPSSSQWIAFNDVLETLNAKSPLLENLNEALAEVDLKWEKDILPLAGDEAYFALTDIDGLDEGRGWVMAFQLRDPQRAEEIFLDLAARSEGEEGEVLLEEEYEGERIYYIESGPANLGVDVGGTSASDVGFAFVNDVSVIGFSRDDVKQVIDVIAGRSPSAQENERLQELRQRQEDDFLFWGYVDLAPFWDAIEDSIPSSGIADFDPEQFFEEARANTDILTFSVSARRNGFVLDTFVYQSPDADPDDATSFATAFDSRYAEMVPADTLIFVAGYDPFTDIDRDALDETGIAADDQTLGDVLDDLEGEIGFNFEDDLIGLMTGEVAFAFNVSNFDSDEPEFDLLTLVDVNDAKAIEETMNRLGDYFERQALLVTESSDREGVYRWAEYEGSENAVAWTVTGKGLALGYPESSVTHFLDGAQSSLADSPEWKRTMDLLPEDKTFIAYLSLSPLIEEIRRVDDIEEQFNEATEGEVTFDDLMRIRSLGIATTSFKNGSGFHMVVLVQD